MLERVWRKGTLLHCWWECKPVQPLWRTQWRFLKKTKIESPYDPAIPLLGIYPEKALIQNDTCSPMFIATLFTIAKMWKQPKRLSIDQFSSIAQLCPTLCNPMNCSTPGLCPSPTPRVHSNSCPSSRWCHPAISSPVVPSSSCPQSLPVSGFFSNESTLHGNVKWDNSVDSSSISSTLFGSSCPCRKIQATAYFWSVLGIKKILQPF